MTASFAGDADGRGDCNDNGIDDAVDIRNGTLEDCDANGLPDVCYSDEPLLHFAPVSNLGIPSRPNAIESADFNADGLADFVIAHLAQDQITVLIRSSEAEFDAPDVMPAATPDSLATRDVNGDGHVDIIATSGFPPSVSIYYNGGPGWFAAPRVIRLRKDISTRPIDLEVDDIDGDGRADLVILFDLHVGWMRGLPNGEFEELEWLLDGPVRRRMFEIALADLDGDSDLDLIIANIGELNVAENVGDGQFTQIVGGLPTDTDVEHIALLDHSVEGAPDPSSLEIAIATTERVQVLRPGPDVPLRLGESERFELFTTEGDDVRDLRAVDLEGDGSLEVSALVGNSVAILTRDLKTAEPELRETGLREKVRLSVDSVAEAFAVGDIDGDRLADLVGIVASDSGRRGAVRIAQAERTSLLVDCNDNGVLDACEIEADPSLDCGGDGLLDACEPDLNENGVSDDCEADCNRNGTPDDVDIATRFSRDCNENGIPDDCETDCNLDEVADECQVASQTTPDENGNGIPDACDAPHGFSFSLAAPQGVDVQSVSAGPIELRARLHMNPTAPPVLGWSIALTSTCPILSATLDGTVGADVESGPPGLRNTGFASTAVVGPPQLAEGQYGVLSAVVLSLTMPIVLEPDGAPYDVLRIMAETRPGSDDLCGECWLAFSDDPRRRRSAPVTNGVTADGKAWTPGLGALTLTTCPVRFSRADATGEGQLNISDGIAIFGYLFLGDAAPTCLEAADANDDARLDIADGIAVLSYLFVDGAAPPSPGPPGSPGCGFDSVDSPGYLGCEAYAGCDE